MLVAFTAVVSPISGSIYLPALPDLASDLNVSASLINLTITTYQIFQGIAPSVIGNFSDLYGRRPAYIISFVIYIVANIGLALQSSYPALMVLRCLQSSGSGVTVALGSAVVSDLVTRAERGRFVGYASMTITLGPALGPIIGGLLTQYRGWRSMFWFLTILSGILILLIVFFLPETCRNVVGNGSVSPPWWGISVMGYIQSKRRKPDGSDPVRIAHDTIQQRKARPNPFASLKVLAEREGSITLGFGALLFSGYFAILTTLSAQLSDRFGFDSVYIGLCYLPVGVGSMFSRWLAGRLMDWNFRRHAKKQGIVIIKNRQQNIEKLPIEKIRLEVCLPFVYISCCTILSYGWVMEEKASLAGILVSLGLFGMFFSGASNVINTLVVDTHKESPATAVAANNLFRCLLGAGATAIATPLINKIGIGWTATFISGLWLFFSPLLWLVLIRGAKWRSDKLEKQLETESQSPGV